MKRLLAYLFIVLGLGLVFSVNANAKENNDNVIIFCSFKNNFTPKRHYIYNMNFDTFEIFFSDKKKDDKNKFLFSRFSSRGNYDEKKKSCKRAISEKYNKKLYDKAINLFGLEFGLIKLYDVEGLEGYYYYARNSGLHGPQNALSSKVRKFWKSYDKKFNFNDSIFQFNGSFATYIEKFPRKSSSTEIAKKELSQTQEVAKKKEGCIKGNCYNGQGTWIHPNGDKYVGKFKNGKPNGQGTLTWADNGDEYVGEFKDSRREGQGTFTWAKGGKYVGQFKDNIGHGQGTFTWANGDKYVGQFKDGKSNGQGTYTFAHGTVDNGVWKNGKLVERNKIGISEEKKLAKKEPKKKEKKKKKIVKVVEQEQEEIKVKTKKLDTTGPEIEIAEAITVDDSSYSLKGKVSDKGSDKIYIKVDGQDIPVKKGKFKIDRYSPEDEEVKIVAFDKYGNKSTKVVKVTIDIKEETVVQKLEPLNPSRVRAKTSGEKVALIIGIENYTEAPKANYANLDAKYFFDYARKAFGVKKQNINLLINEDATFVKTSKALTLWLRTKVKADQTDLIIFFAGHGLASSDGKELYLIAQDSDPNLLSRTALSRTELFAEIINLKPKSVTMFLDTCYSGVSRDEQMLLASARPIRIVADEQEGIPDNFTIFTASQLDQISSGLKEANHGIFSYYLMKGLEGKADADKDYKITNGELLAYMDENVSQKASELGRQQNPSLNGDPDQVLMSYR